MWEEKINTINTIVVRNDINDMQYKQELSTHQASVFQTHPYYPSDGVCAFLTQAVYEDDGQAGDLREGWQLVWLVHDKATEYQGAAYWHNEYRQLVIAHRGTVSLQDWHTNLSAIAQGQYDTQMPRAVEFTLQAIGKVQQQAGANTFSVSITGHSLGGWLAQLTAYHAEEQGCHPHVVSFDSPGCQNMLEYILPRYDANRINLADLDITVYLSAPNLVNTCDTHLGQIFRIYPELPSENRFLNGLKDYFLHTVQTHLMKPIVAVFDETTGKSQSVMHVMSWPSITWKKHHGERWFMSTVFSVLGDKLTQDDAEYQRFFKWANRLNDYDPKTQELSFDEVYEMQCFSHYKTKENNPNSLPLSIFSKTLQAFLRIYVHLNQFLQETKSFDEFHANYSDWSHLKKMLTSFQPDGNWVQVEDHYSTEQWVSYLSFFDQLHPQAAENLHKRINETFKQLENKPEIKTPSFALFKTGKLVVKGNQNIHDTQIFGGYPA